MDLSLSARERELQETTAWNALYGCSQSSANHQLRIRASVKS
jgi:hypothetical protein